MIKYISREPSNSLLGLEQVCKDYFWKASRDIPSPFVLKQSKYFVITQIKLLLLARGQGRNTPLSELFYEPPGKFIEPQSHRTGWAGREIPRSGGDSGRWALSPEESALSALPTALLHQGHQKGTNTAPSASAGTAPGSLWAQGDTGNETPVQAMAGCQWMDLPCCPCPGHWGSAGGHHALTHSSVPWERSSCLPPGRAFPSADGIGNKLHSG